MHPGPMNRGVEIDSAVADGTQAVILPQVTFGIAVRMAVMSILRPGTARMKIQIKNGRVIDPGERHRRAVSDLYRRRRQDRRASAARRQASPPTRTIDASGLVVAPGPGRSVGAPARAGLRIQGDAGIGNGRPRSRAA